MTFYFLTVQGGKQLFEFLPVVCSIDETLNQAKEIHALYPNANITLYSDIRPSITSPKKIGTYWNRHCPNYPSDRVFLTRCKDNSLFDDYIDAKNSVITVLDSYLICLTPWYMTERTSLTERKQKRGYVSQRQKAYC